jgi:hypothetical protein
MSFVEPSPPKPGDDLDGLLRAFFGSQMPPRWPAPPLPPSRLTPTERRPPSGQAHNRSRWALAASVGLLLLGSLFLSGRFTQAVRPGTDLDGPTVSDRQMHQRMEKEHRIKEHENKHKTGFDMGDGDQLPEPDELDMR